MCALCRYLTLHKIIGLHLLGSDFKPFLCDLILIEHGKMLFPYEEAFLLKKCVTNGLWINKQPNWMGFYTRWYGNGWHLCHFILIPDISGRVHFHITECHNAFMLFFFSLVPRQGETVALNILVWFLFPIPVINFLSLWKYDSCFGGLSVLLI